ncbi:MAG: DUF2793 domain-containing protein [Armatimonadota bacterium]
MADHRIPVLATFAWQPPVAAQQNTPPGSPAEGDRYLVGNAPGGAWQGNGNAIAEWNGGAWEFTAATAGMAVWVSDVGALKQFDTSWVDVPKAHAASHEAGGADPVAITDLTDNDTYCAVVKAGLNVSGGGVVSWIANKFKWTYRFIVIAHGRGSHFSTSGYFDITMPTSGTCTGVGGAADAAWGADGITLTSWQALYYILPVGSSNASVPANFRIASYTAGLVVPEDWILLAVVNGDATGVLHCQVCNGMRLAAGDSQLPGGDLPVSMGGTGASDAATAADNLGLGTTDNVTFNEVLSGQLVAFVWQIPGNNLFVGDNQSCSPLIVPFPVTFVRARAAVTTAPTGAAIKFQLTKNGSGIFDESPDLRLQIAAGASSGTATDFTGGISTAVAGDLLNINVDQIGSTVAGGGGCCVILVCKKTGTHA